MTWRESPFAFLSFTGRAFLNMLRNLGCFAVFVVRSIVHVVWPPFFFKAFWVQVARIGYFSLPVVALTTFFTGGVLVLQIYYGRSQLNTPSIIASIVALGMTRELSPVLSGLMVAGRVGAAIAAELGAMRVTEQIDALTALSVEPYKYLVTPRLLAAVITLPLLVLVGDIIGILGGALAAVHSMHVSFPVYIRATTDFLAQSDVVSGLIKAAVFGFIIATMGCFYGFFSARGAQGVGKATTNSVVTSSVLILASNYVMTTLFFT